jgi:hypothetical protein
MGHRRRHTPTKPAIKTVTLIILDLLQSFDGSDAVLKALAQNRWKPCTAGDPASEIPARQAQYFTGQTGSRPAIPCARAAADLHMGAKNCRKARNIRSGHRSHRTGFHARISHRLKPQR